MRVIAVSTLKAFWRRRGCADSEQPLKAWFKEASEARWQNPAELKAQFRSASILKNQRAVFNIKGNQYRLVVALSYKFQIIFVKFVGTHSEYDQIDAETVDTLDHQK